MANSTMLGFMAYIRNEDGSINIIASSEQELPLIHELDTVPHIKNTLDAVEAIVDPSCNKVQTAAVQFALDQISENSITEKPKNPYRKGCQSVDVQMMSGRVHINVPNSTIANEHIGTRTIIFSTTLTKCIAHGAVTQAYRPLADILNRSMERTEDSSLKYRTLATLVNVVGNSIQQNMMEQAYDVLVQNGFRVDLPTGPEGVEVKNDVDQGESEGKEDSEIKDNETSKEDDDAKQDGDNQGQKEEAYQYNYPIPDGPLADSLKYMDIPSILSQDHLEEYKCLIQAIEKYNVFAGKNVVKRLKKTYPEWETTQKKEYFRALNKELDKFLAHEEDIIYLLELPSEKKAYITVDGILTVRQKPHRRGSTKRNGRFLQNHVAVIEADGISKTLTAPDLKLLFTYILAYLIKNNLLEERRLIFFADGAEDIKNGIEATFSFREGDFLFLDWYHCSSKVYQKLSMALKGTKEEKRRIRGYVKGLLWVGNVDAAIKYLTSLIGSKHVKNEDALTGLISYLTRKASFIPCYAIRRGLKYRNSSNRVEQQNYAIVARRQKNNAMSWSPNGSAALAAVTMLVRNQELDEYLETGHVPFRFYPEEQSVQSTGENAS